MEPRLVQNQSQKLILSPQVRQYLRLLQLPIGELAVEIEQALAENPTLQEIAKEPGEESSSPPDDQAKEDRSTEELRFDETLRSLNEIDQNLRDGLYSEEDLSVPEIKEARRQKDYRESLISRKESLPEFLLWQANFLDFTEADRKEADQIIGNLTDDGYLMTPLEEIAQASGTTVPQVEKILQSIQGLEPAGIAARNLQECLLLQLERKGAEAELAQQIVREHFLLLEKKQWDLVAKRLKRTPEEIQQAARLIARLDPKPGRTFYGEDAVTVTPDAAVSYDESEDGRLKLEIHDEDLPEIRINPYHRRLLRDPKLDPASRQFLREKVQSAIDFVKALSQRRSTLREITEEIVRVQAEFFQKGFSHLKPLRLKDISAQLGIHESTVSRAIQGKYLSTPRGTLPYKSFFSSKLERVEGGVESQKSMMEKIRELTRSEDPKNPLSDQAITKILQQEGIRIARRTVAKYRELLKILPSHLRKTK